jgi:hypothetical protein
MNIAQRGGTLPEKEPELVIFAAMDGKVRT